MRVEPGERAVILRAAPRPARGDYEVAVLLPDVGERVLAHCTGRRRP